MKHQVVFSPLSHDASIATRTPCPSYNLDVAGSDVDYYGVYAAPPSEAFGCYAPPPQLCIHDPSDMVVVEAARY